MGYHKFWHSYPIYAVYLYLIVLGITYNRSPQLYFLKHLPKISIPIKKFLIPLLLGYNCLFSILLSLHSHERHMLGIKLFFCGYNTGKIVPICVISCVLCFIGRISCISAPSQGTSFSVGRGDVIRAFLCRLNLNRFTNHIFPESSWYVKLMLEH